MSGIKHSPLLVKCSLAWLKGFGGNYEILADPFDEGAKLKAHVIEVLVNATCYMNAFNIIYPFEKLDGSKEHSFWPVIHGLARNGIYALDSGQIVNHTDLSQAAPFKESSHVALTNALMRAQVSNLITIPRVVRVIRSISTVNSAHELPTTAEGCLFLWLSKVAESVHQNSTNLLQKQKCRGGGFAEASGILEAVRAGQYLPSLLVFYVHQMFTLEDFHFKKTSLSAEQAYVNTQIFAEFCQNHLSPCIFHIPPEVLVSPNIDLLHTDVLVFVARIFDHFEPSPGPKLRKVDTSNAETSGDQKYSTTKIKPLLPLRYFQKPSSLLAFGGKHIGQPDAMTPKVQIPFQEHKSSASILGDNFMRENVFISTSSPLVPSEIVQPSTSPSPCFLEKSFLAEKQHTEASASKAGLPIIRAESPNNSINLGPQSISPGSSSDSGTELVVFSLQIPGEREAALEKYLLTHLQEKKDNIKPKGLWRQRLKDESIRHLGYHNENIPQSNDVLHNPWLDRRAVKDGQSNKSEGGPGTKLENLQRRHKERKRVVDMKREKRYSDLRTEKISDLNDGISHDGPECYIKPCAKSNQRLIKNALCHVCLAGDVNLSAQQLALTALENSSAHHFLIMLKQIINLTFRGLYSYSDQEAKAVKIYGSGPKVVETRMVGMFYKYNSGSKEFYRLHSYSFSLSVDAFTLKQNTRKERNL